jgi:antitoxin FitA
MNLHARNLDDDLIARLKRRAAPHGRSTEAECANILWKKVQQDELLKEEALLAARLVHGAEIELLPTGTR